jgi:rubrerythrin
MSKTVLLFLLLVGFYSAISAQSQKENLAEIRTLYSQIQEEKATYDTAKVDIWDESTEGGKIVKYYKNGKLKLVEKKIFGEMYKETTEFYFDNDQLFFSFVKSIKYNRPIYWDKKMAEEVGENEVFDIRKSIIEENRYYFKDQELFLWIGKNKVELSSPNKKLDDAEKNILKQISRILQE